MLYQLKSLVKKLLPGFLVGGYHFGLTLAAALIYGFPSRKLKVIGITGTNGKSTCVEMLSRILEEAGFKTASLSSIRFRILDKEELNTKRMTMPGRFFVQQFLSRAVKAGCQYAVLEVTSEGIKQHRHRFISFEAAVLTNLTPEHIESHGGFENYRRAKGKLFQAVKNVHVLNLDDDSFDYFSQFKAQEKWGYCLKNPNDKTQISNQAQNPKSQNSEYKILDTKYRLQNLIQADNVKIFPDGSSFVVQGIRFSLKLPGEFNVYNALAGLAVARSQGISLKVCQQALEKIEGLPGRMELVIKEPFKVFVDYAFTPNALEKVYQTLTKNYKLPTNKLICVFGSCGGGRDKWKRPVLGKIASRYCDQIILTNEDPYDENPQIIIDDIERGFPPNTRYQLLDTKYFKIIDRREAINKALSLVQPGDVVVITGKGCEPSICLAGGKRVSWDDRQVVREEFQKLPKTSDRAKSVVFEIMPHTADVGIKVFGQTKEELFKNALAGMTAVMKAESSDEPGQTRKIELKSIDQTVLLVDFLSEILYLTQANREVCSRVRFLKLTETELEAEIFGQKVKGFGEDIKAVTHHDAKIEPVDNGWQATVLFDV